MKTSNNFLVLFFLLFIVIGCQNEKSKALDELSNIELLRGDLILCSGEEFGDVSFSLSCDYSVRETFDLAISLLHSFEYREAEKAFARVLDADPECAMAYWGVAMSIYHELWSAPKEGDLAKGAKLIEIARTLKMEDKERQYLEAIGSFYENYDSVDHKTRATAYEKNMEELYNGDKSDIEATVFYTLALNSTADPEDESMTNQRKAGAILEELFKDQPNHPGIAHYIIHNYDYPALAEKALATARRYADIAPSSAHAQHMPSHIFTRLGLWNESIASNINSASSATCYVDAAGMKGHWFQEVHAIDYLVYAYLQQGDKAKALEQYDYLKTMKEVIPEGLVAVAYPFTAIPARMVLENRNWDEAKKIDVHESNLKMEDYPWQQAILHFARSLGASRSSDLVTAESEMKQLIPLHDELAQEENTYYANQVMIQIKTLEAWLEFGKGNKDAALDLMKEATDMENGTNKHPITPCEVLPASELLGDMLLAMDNPEEALMAYEENLEMRPNRFNSLYGAAIAAKNSGNDDKARTYFEQLIALGKNVGEQRSEMVEAKEYVANI